MVSAVDSHRLGDKLLTHAACDSSYSAEAGRASGPRQAGRYALLPVGTELGRTGGLRLGAGAGSAGRDPPAKALEPEQPQCDLGLGISFGMGLGLGLGVGLGSGLGLGLGLVWGLV